MTAKQLITFTLNRDTLAMIYQDALKCSLGGSSQVRGSDRKDKLLEDQMCGLIGNYALALWRDGDDRSYRDSRHNQNMFAFATSTTHGSPNDQHWSFGRDVAISFTAVDGAYLRYGSRNVESWKQPFGMKYPDAMLTDLESWMSRANGNELAFNAWTTSSDLKPALWAHSTHLDPPEPEWDYYPGEGFYDDVDAMIAHEDSLPPVSRPVDYIRQHGSDFVTWKLGKMAGAIHTGGLSWWDDSEKLPGLSGGSLCALWFEGMGIGILGKQGGYPGPDPDKWENIDLWATNHVKATKDGVPYSNARDKEPAIAAGFSDDSAVVNLISQMQPVDIGIEVIRTFEISENGLEICAKCIQSSDVPDTLYEVLPLYLGEDDNWVLTEIRFQVDGMWVDEPGTCTAVKVERNSHLMLIEFEEPADCSLSDIWAASYQNAKSRLQMLNIDIAQTGEVRYTITGPYVHELRKV